MSVAVRQMYEMVKKLEAQGNPWLEIQDKVEKARITQGGFEPLYAGSDDAPYRMRFVPSKQPQILSRKFDEELNQIAREHSLVAQMRCTGYNLFMDTGKPDGATQRLKKSCGMSYRPKLLKVLYVDKYAIELERPDRPDMPDLLEKVGTRLYNMSAK